MQHIGFAGYLVKPFRQSTLMDVLATVWDAKRTETSIKLVTRHTVAEARAAASVVSPDVRPTYHCRILVVDDNAVNQKVAAKLLEKLGCAVEVAGNGREAVTMATRLPFDLIFMDCQMPEIDGYEATQILRTRYRSTVPIVAMTANAMDGDRDKCLAAGMTDYLSKPVVLATLQRILDKYIGTSNTTSL